MKAAILEIRICPFRVATGIEKIAVLQAATDEYNFVKDEALIGKGLVLVHFYLVSHDGFAGGNFSSITC